MTFEEYKEVIKNGERVEWYGIEVPSALITNRVRALADMVINSLNHLDVEISDLRKGTKELTKKQVYYDAVYRNVQNLPYKMNGLIDDFYMAKRYQIEAEIEEE